MLDWSKKDLGYLPGSVMSDGKDNMLTPSVMQGHELGHAGARLTGYRATPEAPGKRFMDRFGLRKRYYLETGILVVVKWEKQITPDTSLDLHDKPCRTCEILRNWATTVNAMTQNHAVA